MDKSTKTVFVSIVHEDKKAVLHNVERWQRDFFPEINLIPEDVDVRQGGDAEIERYLRELLDQSHVVVFIIGRDMHSKRWIKWEYNYAQNSDKKLVYMHLRRCKGCGVDIFPIRETPRFRLKNFRKLV